MRTMLRLAVTAMAALTLVQANTVKSGGSGKWSDASVWVGNVRPTDKDTVLITGECVVTVDSNYTVSALTVQGGGTLQFDGKGNWIMVSLRDLIIETGGQIIPSAPFTSGVSNNTLSIGGSLTVDGIVKDTVKGTSGDIRSIQKVNMDLWYTNGNVRIKGKGTLKSYYLNISKGTTDTVRIDSGVAITTTLLYLNGGVLDNSKNNIATYNVTRFLESSKLYVMPKYFPGMGVTYFGSTNITTGVELPDTTAQLTNGSAVREVFVSKNVVVTDVLSLNDGRLNSGKFLVKANGSVFNNYPQKGFVNGRFGKPVRKASDTVKVFEVGSEGGYAEVSLKFSTLVPKGTVVVQTVSAFHKAVVDTTAALKRYWSFDVQDTVLFKACTITLRYTTNDLPKGIAEPKLEPLLQVAQWAGGKWTYPTIVSRDTAGSGGTITVSGVTSLTDFVIVVDQKALAVGGNGVAVPTELSLSQNYPNPFNPETKIAYQIPQTGPVTLKVYDILGKEVATLVNAVKNAGDHSAVFDGARLSSGMYLAVLRSGSAVQMRKMMLLK